MGRAFGLKNPQPLMCQTPESGEHGCFFESEGKYYFWQGLECAIFEVVKPKGLHEILTMMKQKGEKGLKYRELDQIGPWV
jgi:hypothetical protein